MPIVGVESNLVLNFEATECNQEIPWHVQKTASEHVPQTCGLEVVCKRSVDPKVLGPILSDEPSFSHMKWLQTHIDCAR